MPSKDFSKNFDSVSNAMHTYLEAWNLTIIVDLWTIVGDNILLICKPHPLYPTSARPSLSKNLEIGRHVEQAFRCNSIAMKSYQLFQDC